MPAGVTRYQALALTTVVATLALIAVGSIVRTTGSGLGCPDWPLCHGRLVPPLERTAIIEYSHRTLAAVVGVLIVATAVATLRLRREDRAARALAVSALPLLALQAWLGKETVERELPPEVVAFHLTTALLLFAVLSLVAAFALQGERRSRIETGERRTFGRITLAAAGMTALVVMAGAYVVGTDASFACSAWPNCPEAPVPFADGGRYQHIHWLHRLMVVGGAAAVGLVALTVWQMREAGPALHRGAHALAGLYALQVLGGALNIWSELSEAARVLHLALSAAIWGLLIVLAFAGQYRPAPEQAEARSAPSEAARGGREREQRVGA
jgi:heme A synthase